MSDVRTPRAHAHGIVPMTGRNPSEGHRASSPLEAFFDLTFAIAFGAAGNQAAHLLSEGHWAGALLGFGFAIFAIVWAWVNFTWFASAFDTDDWLFRVLTMVQMTGVLVLAVGLTPMFRSIDEGQALHNGTMVLGYVIMRVAQVAQWSRAWRQGAPELRDTCRAYALGVLAAQVGWCLFFLVHPHGLGALVGWVVMLVLELGVPVYAERQGTGTPWHPHHIAERYSLLAIIALGECLIGAIATLAAVIADGWTLDVALVGLAGTGLAFGLWWVYFLMPSGPALEAQRRRAFAFGYGHIPVFAAIAAIGAGLHVAANELSGESHLSTVAVVLCVAVPVAVFAVSLGTLYDFVVGFDGFHLLLKAVEILVLGAAVALAASGVRLTVCLLVVMLAPVSAVVGDEWFGAPRREAKLADLEAHAGGRTLT